MCSTSKCMNGTTARCGTSRGITVSSCLPKTLISPNPGPSGFLAGEGLELVAGSTPYLDQSANETTCHREPAEWILAASSRGSTERGRTIWAEEHDPRANPRSTTRMLRSRFVRPPAMRDGALRRLSMTVQFFVLDSPLKPGSDRNENGRRQVMSTAIRRSGAVKIYSLAAGFCSPLNGPL